MNTRHRAPRRCPDRRRAGRPARARAPALRQRLARADDPLTVVRGELELLGRSGDPPDWRSWSRPAGSCWTRCGEARPWWPPAGHRPAGRRRHEPAPDGRRRGFLSALAERWTAPSVGAGSSTCRPVERSRWLPTTCTRVVDNLLENAVRHTRDGAFRGAAQLGRGRPPDDRGRGPRRGHPRRPAPARFERFYHGGLTGARPHGTASAWPSSSRWSTRTAAMCRSRAGPGRAPGVASRSPGSTPRPFSPRHRSPRRRRPEHGVAPVAGGFGTPRRARRSPGSRRPLITVQCKPFRVRRHELRSHPGGKTWSRRSRALAGASRGLMRPG